MPLSPCLRKDYRIHRLGLLVRERGRCSASSMAVARVVPLFFLSWVSLALSATASKRGSVQELLRGWLREVSSQEGGEGGVTELHAVVASTSRTWQNYRHMANALTVYSILKQQGVPDSRILLMLAGSDGPCSPRSAFPGGVYRTHCRKHNLFGGHDACALELQRQFLKGEGDVQDRLLGSCVAGGRSWEGAEIDVRGDSVSVRRFLATLTGRLDPETPLHQRLSSGPNSAVLVFLTGHGGDEFFKFSDWEALHAEQLAEVVAEMRQLRRFRRMLIIAETCQAATMLHKIDVPGVLRVSSSLKDESSYSFVGDREVGASLIDRWTYSAAVFLSKDANADAKRSLSAHAAKNGSEKGVAWRGGVGRLQSPVSDLLAAFDPSFLMAHVGVEEKLGDDPDAASLSSLPLAAFFSSRVQPIELSRRNPLSTESAAKNRGAEELPLWHSSAFRFVKLQQQQQEFQNEEFEETETDPKEPPSAGAALSALFLGMVFCALTASVLE